MTDEFRAREKLTGELEELRRRLAETERLKGEYQETKKTLEQRTHDLEERVKELDCFYAISSLVEKKDISLEEVLQGFTETVPSAWQYPEITCSRIVLGDREFRTTNFRETPWRQASEILVQGMPGGTLEVYLLEERPESDEGPFLKEERSLINALAGRLGRITERKQAEEALQESEQRFRDLVENSLTGISIIQGGRIVYLNPEQHRLLGSVPDSFRFSDFQNIHPDDLEKVKSFYEMALSGQAPSLDMEFRFYPLGNLDTRGDMRWVHCRASCVRYQGEKSLLVNMMDITRAKELEHLLRVQDKMTSLGRVATGIAHEIRNPLSGINIYLNTLEKIYDKGEHIDKVKEILGQLLSASNKIESVIRRVMDFSKSSEPKFVLADITQPLKEALKLSSVTLRKMGIKLEEALAEDLPPCRADQQLIEQVILNLITNAAEATKNVDGAKIIGVTSSVENNRILVRIFDSGPGVPLDLREKIFDPFYSTKNGSTGIGLSLSRRIVTDHGGSIEVFTSKWGGAEFVINIPFENGIEQT